MRIKRSSSKKNQGKNSRFFHSGEISTTAKNKSSDSREKSGKLSNIKSNEDFDKQQKIVNNAKSYGVNQLQYQNHASKLEVGNGFIEVKPSWDKRFIDHSSKGITYELMPNPDINYMKQILENEKDER